MKRIVAFFLAIIMLTGMLLYSAPATVNASQSTVIDSTWTIVTGTDVVEQTAAEDLKKYLQNTFGVTVNGPVEALNYSGSTHGIFIGTTKDNSFIATENSREPFNLNSQETESYHFVYRNQDNRQNLWIVGQSAKGSMNGTFRFEELDTVVVSGVDEAKSPAFTNRIGGSTFVQNPPADWTDEQQASYFAHHYINVVWNEKYTNIAPPVSPEMRVKYGLGLMQEVKLPPKSTSADAAWFSDPANQEAIWQVSKTNSNKVIDPFDENGFKAYYDAFKTALIDNSDITVLYTLFGDYSYIPNITCYDNPINPADVTEANWNGSVKRDSNGNVTAMYTEHTKYEVMSKIMEAMKKAVDDVEAANPNRTKVTPVAWLWHAFFGNTAQEEPFMVDMNNKGIGVFYNEAGNNDDWAYKQDNFNNLVLKTDPETGKTIFGDKLYVLTSAGGSCESLEPAITIPLPQVAGYKLKKLYDAGIKNFALWWGSGEGWDYNTNMEVIKHMVWSPEDFDINNPNQFNATDSNSVITKIALRDFGQELAPGVVDFWKSMDKALVTTAPIYGGTMDNYPDASWENWGMQIFSWYQRLGTFTNTGFWQGYKAPLLPSIIANQKHYSVVYGWSTKQQALDNFKNVIANLDIAVSKAKALENTAGISADVKEKVSDMRRWSELLYRLITTEYNFMRGTKVVSDNNLQYNSDTQTPDPAVYDAEVLKQQMRPIIMDEIANAKQFVELLKEFPSNVNLGNNFEQVIAHEGGTAKEIATLQSKVANMQLWLDNPYDLAQNRPVKSSSDEGTSTAAEKAVDNDSSTRWSSSYNNDNWFYVDLGVELPINYVSINWNQAYAAQYEIQVSKDLNNGWTTVYSTANGTGGREVISLPDGITAKYVKFLGIKRGSMWGYSFYDFKVYGEASTPPVIPPPPAPPEMINLALGKTTTASSIGYDGGVLKGPNRAVDGIVSNESRWYAGGGDPQWISVDLGEVKNFSKVQLNWEGSFAKEYRVEISNDASDNSSWITVFSTTAGAKGLIDIPVPEGTAAQYVRVYVTKKNSPTYSVSLYELGVLTPAPPRVTSLEIEPGMSIELIEGQEQQLTVNAIYNNGTEADISNFAVYTTSDSAISVSEAGLINAVEVGEGTIKVEYGGQTAQVEVTVIDPSTVPTELIVTPGAVTITEGQQQTFAVEAVFGEIAESVTTAAAINISDPDIVAVSDGTITAKEAGQATIEFSYKGIKTQIDVLVKAPVKLIRLEAAQNELVELTQGQQKAIAVNAYYSDGTVQAVADGVVYSTLNNKVATVENGIVTAVKEGHTAIEVIYGGAKTFAGVIVKPETTAVTSVTLSKTVLSLKEGDLKTLIAVVYPVEATNKRVIWSSSDNEIATVENGIITALKAGTAEITATTQDSNRIAACTVTVITNSGSEQIPVTGIELDKSEILLRVNDTDKLVATVMPEDATTKDLIWSSSDSTVAAADQVGNIKALKAGTAVITVTPVYGTASTQCTVTVVDKYFVMTPEFNMTNLQAGEDLTAQVEVTNFTDTPGEVLLIAALYDKDNTMLQMDYSTAMIESEGSKSLQLGFRLPAEIDGHKVKIFLWDGTSMETTNMYPLADTVVFQ